MLEIQNLHASYGQAQVLFNVSLLVPRGNMLLIRGLNGAGKSSLLKAIMGLMPQSTGNVLWQGQALHSLKPHERSLKGLGYVPEDRRLFSALTVRQNLEIATPKQPKHRPHGQLGLQLQEVLELFPSLSSMLERPAAQMSGGEQQMLALARTLMTGPRLLLLDEPCEGIAPVLVAAMRDALLQLAREGVAMLVAEQNNILAQHAQRVLVLTSGRMDLAA